MLFVNVIPYASDAMRVYKKINNNRMLKDMNKEIKKQTIILDALNVAILMENYSEYNYAWERLHALERPEISFKEYMSEVNMIQDAFYKSLGKWKGKKAKVADDYIFLSQINFCIAYTFLLKGEQLNLNRYIEDSLDFARNAKEMLNEEKSNLERDVLAQKELLNRGLKIGAVVAMPYLYITPLKTLFKDEGITTEKLIQGKTEEFMDSFFLKEKNGLVNNLNSKIEEISNFQISVESVQHMAIKNIKERPFWRNLLKRK